MSMSYLPKKYKIESIKKYTDDVWLFKIKCDMNPQPGRFFEVSVPGVGECPLASCSCEEKYVEMLTKNVGTVTNELFKLAEGDDVWIRGPYGRGFPTEKLKKRNLIMVAAGTGIAPITSMIHFVEKNREAFGEVWVYLGFHDEEHILLENRIKRWKEKFHVHVGLSQDPDTHKYECGFVQEIMKKHKPKIEDTAALLCGPEKMMEAVTKELNNLRVTNHNIYWSLERRMECAFGSCGRCQIQDLYVCKDGPIFQYDKIKTRLANEKWSNKNWSEENEKRKT